MRLARAESFLLIIDAQERLAPHVQGSAPIVARCAALLRAARLLGVPAVVSEHCPEAIGATVEPLRALAPRVLRKSHFACTDEPGFAEALGALGRRQAVVAGMEAHVCVMQTALGLLDRGYRPFVVLDAVGSRRESDREAGLERLRAAGALAASTEMVLFEWLGGADVPEFRDVLALVKGAAA